MDLKKEDSITNKTIIESKKIIFWFFFIMITALTIINFIYLSKIMIEMDKQSVKEDEVVIEEQYIDYKYYDKFCQFLKDTSPTVYSNMDDEFMRNEYKIWYTNNGYADIIIDLDGNLVNVFNEYELMEEYLYN